MRAFSYWLGAQFWGDMPLLLTEVSSPSEAVPEGGRPPKAQILQQVVTDLQDAIGKLPASYSGGDVGRITRGRCTISTGQNLLAYRRLQQCYQSV